MRPLKFLSMFLVLAGILAFAAPAVAADPDNTMIITLKDGNVVVALRPDLAPKAVAQIKKLVRAHAYDNVAFHRVIGGFMAQTGDVEFGNLAHGYDPERVGTGKSKLPNLPAEFSDAAHFVRGAVGMARAQDPDSANSQFFIMFAPAPSLDGKYTIVGNVVSGMQYIDEIKHGDPSLNGAVKDPDRMIKVRMESDVKKKQD